MKHGDTLQAARQLLCRDRDRVRGDPYPVHALAAEIATLLLPLDRLRSDLRASDVARVMIAVKFARELEGQHDADNLTDACAYADILAYCMDREQQIEEIVKCEMGGYKL